MGKVTVVLEKLTNLKDGDGVGGGKSDPYVKLELSQDGLAGFDKSFGEQESSHKDNTVAPEFHETFTWTVPESDVGGLQLTCTVMDSDIGLDDKVGKCTIRLVDIGGDLSHFCAVEKKLDNKWFSADAKLYLKVKFEK